MRAATNNMNQLISGVSPVTPWPRKIYHDADKFWDDSKNLHYAYIVYRTLRGDHRRIFQPSAVLYVGRSPAAYLKTVTTNKIAEDDVRDWQRFLWNQAVVPMLIVKSRSEIRVYTAYTEPLERGSQQRLVALLEQSADALRLDQLYNAIESGAIYEFDPQAFQRSTAVDRYLLRNLTATAHDLAETQPGGVTQDNLEFAHRFLTRLLFVCYLIERGMIKGEHFKQADLRKLKQASERTKGYFLHHLFAELTAYSKRRDALCRIFARVKERFNSSLFPESVTREKGRYNEAFVNRLNAFLQGHDTSNKQFMLPFWFHDFSVIPIETISAVYEEFLGAEGKIRESLGDSDSQRSSGAYYTPLHLAELTVDVAIENTSKPIHELKVLDPACGSGVFLVSLFGRMAESLRRKRNHINKGRSIDWARKLLPMFRKLYGIDISLTACHITCFSLYLAFLEQLQPADVEYLHQHGEKLPPLLNGETRESTNTIHHGNLFDHNLSLDEQDFDIVIGNPPWVSRGKQKDPHFLRWRERDPQVRGPLKQIAHGFMWKAREYLSDSGTACLLLPSAVLLNSSTNKFQAEWLTSVTVDRVINFADLRWLLFPGADHPCVAIRFGKHIPDVDANVCYESPKTDIRSQKGGPVFIREEDVVKLHLNRIIRAATTDNAPFIWKCHYWGTWRDQRLISRLSDLPKLAALAGEPAEGKRWMKGQGIQVTGDNNLGWWKPSTPYLDSDADFDVAIPVQDLQSASQAGIPDKVHRPRKEELFKGPKVLLSKGSRKVIFCSKTLLFKDTFTSIKGDRHDADLLRFLAALLGSDLIYYYLFHTNSNLALYRPQVYPEEFLSIPFFLPEDAADPQKAQKLVRKAAHEIEFFEKQMQEHGWFGCDYKSRANRLRQVTLEPLVRAYYNIDEYEQMLIKDTLQLAEKSYHPRINDKRDIPTLKNPSGEKQRTYVQLLCEMLNSFGKESKFKVKGKVIRGYPYSIVHLSLTKRVATIVPISEASNELQAALTRIRPLLRYRQGRFAFCQNLKIFDGDTLYILKPMQMRFWSRTAALNDADEIAGSILQSRRSH